MPEVEVKKKGNKYRLVEKGTNRIAKTEATGKPRDGGGHEDKAKAIRQAGYVNEGIKKKYGK